MSDLATHHSADLSEDVPRSPTHSTPGSPTHATPTKEGNPLDLAVPELSDNPEEIDFDSDLSGLLSDGDYVPSTGPGGVARGGVSPFVAPTLSGGGVAGLPPRLLVDPASTDDLQDKVKDGPANIGDLQDRLKGDLANTDDLQDKLKVDPTSNGEQQDSQPDMSDEASKDGERYVCVVYM